MIELIKKDLNYSLREREAFLEEQNESPTGGVLLKTCNRVEIYSGGGICEPRIVEHLFRVVSGLESAFLGESAIQGQVKNAYLAARPPLNKELHRLFQTALRVGKRVRRETGISRGALSHGLAVIEILKTANINIRQKQILIIGVSNINLQAIKYLVKLGINTLFVANRNFEKVKALSHILGCRAVRFDKFYEILPLMDIVISATAAPHLIIQSEKYQPTKPQIFFDLAIPRDIDPRLGNNKLISFYNIEDIEKKIKINQHIRQNKIKLAEAIIKEELGKYHEQTVN